MKRKAKENIKYRIIDFDYKRYKVIRKKSRYHIAKVIAISQIENELCKYTKHSEQSKFLYNMKISYTHKKVLDDNIVINLLLPILLSGITILPNLYSGIRLIITIFVALVIVEIVIGVGMMKEKIYCEYCDFYHSVICEYIENNNYKI